MKKLLFVLLSVCLLVTACTSDSSSLIGKWTLTAYGPEGAITPAVTGSGAGLTFNEDGTVNGNSGCNGVGGDYSVSGNEIEFGQFVSTLMACDEPIMSQESAMMQVVSGTASYDVNGETLTLKNGDMTLEFSAAR